MKLADIVYETYVDALKVKRGWFNKRSPRKIDLSSCHINQEVDPYIREIINTTWRALKDLRKGRFTIALEWVKDRPWRHKKWYGFKYWLWTYRCKRKREK